MERNEITRTRRVGRPCGVCALDSQHRTMLETQLAQGLSISRISRQDWAPGRESIAHHLDSGHLRSDLQQQAERAQGFDYVTVAARVSDIAQRARQTALEAAEAADRVGVLRAGDSELRALSVLTAAGETSEREIALRAAHRDLANAVIRLARHGDAETAERVAEELDRMNRSTLADELRSSISEMTAPEGVTA